MGMFDGKKGLILGVANDRSIAWAIAQVIMEQGGVWFRMPTAEDDVRRSRGGWRNAGTASLNSARSRRRTPISPRSSPRRRASLARSTCCLHRRDTRRLEEGHHETSREGFKRREISAYSLLAVCNAAKEIMSRSSILTLTYFGGEKIVSGYNVMGICKAALDSCMKYAAYDLGPKGIRVNALSAGPLKTLAGSAAGVGPMQDLYEKMAPLGRNVTHDEVGKIGAFLLSDMADGITAEILHVDGGYNAMGSPGRLLDAYKT
jgi:enoyl-[acyl-carrier protein] reductase I